MEVLIVDDHSFIHGTLSAVVHKAVPGAAIHVDGVVGLDTNSGIGSVDGDFSAAKKTIFAAFTAGNATAAPYRVIVKAGTFENAAFTNNAVESAGFMLDRILQLRCRHGPLHRLLTHVRAAIRQVVSNRIMEEKRLLLHDTHPAMP